MKIIQLLNKIADGEEVPKKIKYKNKIYEWKEYDVCYGKIMTKKGWIKELGYVTEENRTYFYLKHCYQDLNDEVEIIEEEKKIPEKLKIEQDTPTSNYYIRNENGTKCALTKHSKMIAETLNQVIDYLKSKGE